MQEKMNLREREKELRCIHRVHQVLQDQESTVTDLFRKLVRIIPEGWQFPGICMARIEYQDTVITSPGFFRTRWYQSSDIIVEGSREGNVSVYYKEQIREENLFLPEEKELLNIIAQQISQYLANQKLHERIDHFQDPFFSEPSDQHWKWRYQMVEYLAEVTDFEGYGIRALYIIGSTKEARSGPQSDIDLLIHIRGDDSQRQQLKEYIKGWSMCLAKWNQQRTGLEIREGLIDLHLVTDSDILQGQNSFAAMIDSHSNSARLIKKTDS